MNKKLFIIPLALFGILLGCNKKGPNSEVDKDYINVHFETCIDLETNVIEDQHLQVGDKVDEPAVVVLGDDSYDQKISGWYTENSYVNKWDFLSDTVSQDMTLYAKWVDVITIFYYLKGSSTPIWVVSNANAGDPLERHDELCDGYEFYGYFSDPACTVPFDLEKPLDTNTTVYLYRSETLSLNPHSIKRRFSMIAAGGTGSSTGTISNVQVDENGEEYVDVNFGYSVSADPYMLISNPQIDISNSQKIQMKYKNLGGAFNIGFYWVSKYADGSYASGQQFDSEANAAHYPIPIEERNMDPDGPWIEKEFDLSSVYSNGVSPWGNSVTLVHLRIQFSYISTNVADLSNIVRFQYIRGVSDDTNKGFKDSQAIQELLVDDSETALATAASAQNQNRGVIFPKNNDCVTDQSTEYFKKTDGLLMYSPYGSDIRRYFFDVEDQQIDATEYSYVTIKFKNLSYIPSFTFYVTTFYNGLSLNNVATVSMPIRMSQKDDSTLNFYGKTNMLGTIKSFSILFNYNGVDNAILLESITMSENRSFQIPGINFNDPDFGGLVPGDGLSLNYIPNSHATSFVHNSDSISQATLNYDYIYDITPYENITLKYLLPDTGVNRVIVSIKINSHSYDYIFDELSTSISSQSITLPLRETGILQTVTISIDGKGAILLSEIEFTLNEENSIDFSDPMTYGVMLDDWSAPLSYVEDKKAVIYKNGSEGFRYYFGFLNKSDKRKTPNVSLENKHNIYIIYQNLKGYGDAYINCYALNKNTTSDYITGHSENASDHFIHEYVFSFDKNMDDRAWNIISIPIPSIYTNGDYYFSNMYLGSLERADISVYIRGIAVV